MNAAGPVDRLIAVGGQKAFLPQVGAAAGLGSIGFSLPIFGAFSGLLSTMTDQLILLAIGLGMMLLAGWVSYAALNCAPPCPPYREQ
ncbi:MAG: hypothetical protein V5A38_14275 [Halolamina sp.]|uniref:hypothetical protein n=1 Tax=Halolamina sp. TaxID=1940283 RepID=UPI002FC33C12